MEYVRRIFRPSSLNRRDMRRGHVAPKTTVIETIIRKFDTHNRSFLVANAQPGSCHIIYCSDGFCKMSGFSRAEVIGRASVCDFLHGPMTSQLAVQSVKQAFSLYMEKHQQILYYRKDGNKFEPQLVDNAYKVHMKLIIKSVSASDFGTYKCVSKNSLGHTDGSIKLYQVTKEMSHRTRNKGRKHESNEVGLEMTGDYKETRHNGLDSPEAKESTGSSSSRLSSWSSATTAASFLYYAARYLITSIR